MFDLPKNILFRLDELSETYGLDKNEARAYSELFKNYRNQNFKEMNFSHAIAYALGRMPATYGVIKYVLERFKNTGENFSNILDIGAGVGALKIALQDCEINYEALEKSEAMRKVFRKLNGDNSKIYSKDFQKFQAETSYQAVFASYFINEIEDKILALKKIFDLSEKYVFILEPGTPSGFKNILEAKKIAAELDWYPLLPCATRDCKLSDKDWCHFSIRLPRTKHHMKLKNAALPYEDEKFCYVIFSKKETKFFKNNIIIKRPIKKSGHTIFDVCTSDGIHRVVRTDKASKKLQWGDQL
ncbi:MAG: small ribosomal subunit Rsm22 family protein [Alphaproteobacteria bacterium]|nr:small ribosomal subunit Rsm22 family protein [Alphaproteobacteria bacterium]